LGTKCCFIGGKEAEAWGWTLPCMLRSRMRGTIRRLSTHVSLTWAGSDLCFWFLCMCVAFPIVFCFNLYCGGFILFCNVCVCKSFVMCGCSGICILYSDWCSS
jgi:hypothetical protein